MEVIQNMYGAGLEYDFTGSPIIGVNRLVTTFSILDIDIEVYQDTYSTGEVVQDVYG